MSKQGFSEGKETVPCQDSEGGTFPKQSDWIGPEGLLGSYIKEESEKTLDAYRRQPHLISEHANHEEDTARGGYANRQLFELVQNSADTLAGSTGGRIFIKLTHTHLYCADDGLPISMDGVRALMFSHLSGKRGTSEIGRFGLGFKSVLGVTDSPEFISRPGSFRFDRIKSTQTIRAVAPNLERYPVLRLPESIDPWPLTESDPSLQFLASWAVNIVRLPLRQGASETLAQQLRGFPSEFLLFVDHVSEVTLQSSDHEVDRTITLDRDGWKVLLNDEAGKGLWMLFNDTHRLSSEAQNDSRTLDNAEEVQVSWAVPTESVIDPGRFWAFFPTHTSSLLAGILNAPWKTNEDRQNLLSGVYNDELLCAAARMVAKALPSLSGPDDPGKHIDALPRRLEAGDGQHSTKLRSLLDGILKDGIIAPDQNGRLRKLDELSYPPRELTNDVSASPALQCWESYENRPTDWLHHGSLSTNRLARLERIYAPPGRSTSILLPRSSIANWLQALAETAGPDQDSVIEASIAAIQTAALIPHQTRSNTYLGKIVLKADGMWESPSPGSVFLGDDTWGGSNLVHPKIQADPDTVAALVELGINYASEETSFDNIAKKLLGPGASATLTKSDQQEVWTEFWILCRRVDPSVVQKTILDLAYRFNTSVLVRTISGNWRPLYQALLPGKIVPADGSRDRHVAIDVQFHEPDIPLLHSIGAVDSAHGEQRPSQRTIARYRDQCRNEFRQQDLPRIPQARMLNLWDSVTSGPLEVLEVLSEEGNTSYTWELLTLDRTFAPWTMGHDTQQELYPPKDFESPALWMLRKHGLVMTEDGSFPLTDGIGNPPKNEKVLEGLLKHPNSEKLRQTFGIPRETSSWFEVSGEDGPVPLSDVWPGLRHYIPLEKRNLQLIRCDYIVSGLGEAVQACLLSQSVCIVRNEQEIEELQAVLDQLSLGLTSEQVSAIIGHRSDSDVREARKKIRECETDAERVLCSVGESNLRGGLPVNLVNILEETHGRLSGIQVAQAAISTYHTGALRQYRHALAHLDPPSRWAGTQRAVEFVRSLGFGEEWAGEESSRRDPFIEVNGPYSLPGLHDYQRTVVDNIGTLLSENGGSGERRGMVSMPTGSGKTRVAVQAIVEAIKKDGFRGGVLWVADRDELCEQAVEAWRQVWSSEGAQGMQLRISRMWAGQPQPLPTSEMHVIVATVQTLSSRIGRQPNAYEFLSEFKILVFDEAHRSVAPTYTAVMDELGLTRWRRGSEPFLLGLTATPYRGHDVQETARLVSRYGRNRLDAGAFESDHPEEVIKELQKMKVLASADHEIIEGGRFFLTPEEQQLSKETPWLPQSVENRIASDPSRTRRIVEAYKERVDPDWPTLIFATSVEHSQTVAALLSSMGVRARAVSGLTDTAIRRRVVEEFRSDEVKVLVNYGVFREGFDAPKTRAIIVARPVYSPNLYFQMVGRGLRGVKNGGNERCLVLNVRDNIENFERRLAFSDLDWLWS